MTDPTTPPPDLGPESNAPEGAVPVDSTRTEPDGPAVVAVPADQLDEAAAGAEPTATVRAASVREVASGEIVGDELAEQPDAETVPEAVDREPTGLEADDEGDGEPVEGAAARYTVTEGAPGRYEPDASASERPRNVTELRSSARPATRDAWRAGSYVLVGTTGKRAHWTGDDWHTGEAPEPAGDGDEEVDGE